MLTGRLILAAAALGVGMASMPVFAQGSLPDQLAVCARIGKKDARLECYDSIARAASQGSYTSSFGAATIRTPQPAPSAVTPAAPSASAGFGGEQIARPITERKQDESQNEIDIAVASSRDNGLGMYTINLTDGAVWRMTERAANFRPPAPQEVVSIRKGALGSYLMQVGKQESVRVERVR